MRIRTRWASVVAMATLVLGTTACGDAPYDSSIVSQETAPTVDLSAMNQTSSGLHWMDLVVGDGTEAATGQRVTVHYIGWFLDGETFDSSLDRGEPYSFQLGAGGVIAGWEEGVVGMRVGGIRRLVIPPSLAYGEAGRQGIPPNSTLVFDVELVDVTGG